MSAIGTRYMDLYANLLVINCKALIELLIVFLEDTSAKAKSQ